MRVKKNYPRLRQQGPRYYYDHGGKPRRWEPLGKDWHRAMIRYNELERAPVSENTVSWLIDKYIKSKTDLRPNTLKSYRVQADLANRGFGDRLLSEVDRGHVMQFIDEYPKRQMALKTADFLKSIYSFALDRQMLTVNPLAGMKMKGRGKRDRYLTDAEFLAIREKMRPVYQIAMDLAYLLGLRVSGVVALRFSHIKDGILTFQPPKSKKPITYQLSDEVKNVIERARTLPGSVRGLTVVCKRNGSPLNEITISRAYYEAARAAEIKNTRFHDIRAKSASDDAATAQGRLGHLDARTTGGYLRKPQVVFPIKNVKL